jgi:regulator of protease activity HflC (stomatin/prohibitin superfamily)
MQIVAAAVPGQEAITRDNVTLRVDAVVYYRVIDPIKAIINVQNYKAAVSQVAQTSLRSVIGQSCCPSVRRSTPISRTSSTPPPNSPEASAWERVEVKDVALPKSMKRSMSRQAEAERERRARIISADGEYQASKKLAQAASVMVADPAALQLRLLQTVVEVAAEKNSMLVVPVPVELLRFFERAAPPPSQAEPPAADAQDTGASPLPVPEMPALPVPASAALPAPFNAAPKTPAAV